MLWGTPTLKKYMSKVKEKTIMTDDQLWQVALGQLELKISKGNYLTWFASTKIKDRQDGRVMIETPSAFTFEWLSKKYRNSILEVLQTLDNTITTVEFTIESLPVKQRQFKKNFRIMARKADRPAREPVQKETALPEQSNNPAKAPEKIPSGSAKTLNPKYTFESYVVGSSNEIAHAACRAVAERPGQIYNPLFIYGGVGLGKTHLLQAIGNSILAKNPAARVLYVSSEKFINEFVQSIKERSTQAFKRFYRDVEMLIIDDVQFLAGKVKTQEELFHTYNALYSQNIPFILSSDRSPRAIPTFEERLRSRLAGGMIADIQQPDYETRLAIIKEKAEQRGIPINEDSLAYIAKNVQKNVRELEGALNRVLAYCELTSKEGTLEYTKKMMEGILDKSQQRSLDSKSVLEVVSAYYNISMDDLCGKSRKKEVVKPRQVAMYLLRKENSVSFPTIGEFFGGRDHTTAMHACEKVGKLLEHDEELTQELNFIKERLYA